MENESRGIVRKVLNKFSGRGAGKGQEAADIFADERARRGFEERLGRLKEQQARLNSELEKMRKSQASRFIEPPEEFGGKWPPHP